MGLLNYITATSLDEDYAHVSERRGRDRPRGRRRFGPDRAWSCCAVFGVLVAIAALQTSAERRRVGQLAGVAGQAGRRPADAELQQRRPG